MSHTVRTQNRNRRSLPAHRDLATPRVAIWAVAVITLVAIPFYVEQSWLQAGLFGMAAAIGAIGLNVLTGAAGQISLGHAFFLAVGAYAYVWLSSEGSTSAGIELTGLGLPTPIAAVGAVLIAGLAGGLFSPISARLKGASLGIATLALVFIGQHLLFRSESVTGGVNGRDVPVMNLGFIEFGNTPDPVSIGGVPFTGLEKLWFLGLALLGLSAWFARGVLSSRPGRALNTIRDHEIAAGALGVPVARTRAAAFVLSSMYAGLAGVMIALVFQRVVPEYFGFLLALEYLAMIVIGGLGSVGGAVAGAAIVAMLPSILTRYSDSIPFVAPAGTTGGISGPEAARLFYGIVFVAILLYVPGGLAGGARRLRLRLANRRARPPQSPKPPADDPQHEESKA